MGHVRRRQFLSAAGALLAVPLGTGAQQQGRIVRLGFVTSGTAAASDYLAGFRDELRKLGWIEGQNIIIEYRYGMGIHSSCPNSLRNCSASKLTSS